MRCRFELKEVELVTYSNRMGKNTKAIIIRVISRDIKQIRQDLGLPPSHKELNHHITVLKL